MYVGDGRDRGSHFSVCVLVCFYAAMYSKVQDVVRVKLLGIKELQMGLGTISSSPPLTYVTSYKHIIIVPVTLNM